MGGATYKLTAFNELNCVITIITVSEFLWPPMKGTVTVLFMSQARGVVHYSSFFGFEIQMAPWAILSAIIYFHLPLLQLMEMASAENSASEKRSENYFDLP